jgi:DNA-binding MurR/RpiR family transcriptional regulator
MAGKTRIHYGVSGPGTDATAAALTAPGTDAFAEAVARHGASLSPAGRRIVRYIDQNRAAALASSALELAASTGSSDATVVRSVQALGFAGLGDLKQALVASLQGPSTPADDMRRTLEESGASTAGAVEAVLDAHADALTELRTPQSRDRIVKAVSVLHPAHRVVVFGIGPSAPLARYVAVLLARVGRRSMALNAAGIMLADQLLDLRSGDALLVLAYGRPYREVLAVSAEAVRLGLPIVLVTDAPAGKIAQRADVVLEALRGRAGRVALHGATLAGLEAVVLGLAAAGPKAAMLTLGRLNELRVAVSGQQNDVG